MIANYSPFLVEFTVVEQVFQPQNRSFVPIFFDFDAHTEQLFEHTVRAQLGSIRNGLVVELVDDLFVGQAFTS